MILSKDVISYRYWYAFTCSYYVFLSYKSHYAKISFIYLYIYIYVFIVLHICSLTIWLSLGRRFQWLYLVKMFGAWVWLTIPYPSHLWKWKFGTLAFQRKQRLEGCSIFHGPWLLEFVGSHSSWNTPLKFNMEPEVWGLEDYFPGWFLGFMLIFRGVFARSLIGRKCSMEF